MFPPLCQEYEAYVFVDYAPCDRQTVAQTVCFLHGHGVRLWHDEGRGYDTMFMEEVARRIEHCDVFLLFLSQKALQSGLLGKEFRFACMNKRRILPIFLENVQLPPGMRLLLDDCGEDKCALYTDDPAFDEKLLAAVKARN